MTLLSGIRNLIGRKRESLTDDGPAIGADQPADEILDKELSAQKEAALSKAGMGAMAEIEAKASMPAFHDAAGSKDQAPADHEVARRLQEIDQRLGAAGAETRRLVKELDGHMDSKSADVQRLVQKLDERIARLLELVGDQAARPADHDQAITAAVDAAAQRFTAAAVGNSEAVRRMQGQVDSMAEAVTRTGEQTDKLAFTLDEIRARTTDLDDAITRIGQSIVQREETVVELLKGTRRSMMLFAYGCTLASLLAMGIAFVALILT